MIFCCYHFIPKVSRRKFWNYLRWDHILMPNRLFHDHPWHSLNGGIWLMLKEFSNQVSDVKLGGCIPVSMQSDRYNFAYSTDNFFIESYNEISFFLWTKKIYSLFEIWISIVFSFTDRRVNLNLFALLSLNFGTIFQTEFGVFMCILFLNNGRIGELNF